MGQHILFPTPLRILYKSEVATKDKDRNFKRRTLSSISVARGEHDIGHNIRDAIGHDFGN